MSSWRLSAVLACVAGCETFDPAPTPSLAGAGEGGEYPETAAAAPLRILFSEPVRRRSVRLEIARFRQGIDVDAEGRLLDEQGRGRNLNLVLSYDGSTGEAAQWEGEGDSLQKLGDPVPASMTDHDTVLEILPARPFALGMPLIAVLEPGLEDRDGHATRARIRLPLSFGVVCPTHAPSGLQSGAYFQRVDVDPPPQWYQILTLGFLEVDPQGNFVLEGAGAKRDEVLDERPACGDLDCPTGSLCRLVASGGSGRGVPVHECAASGDPVGSVDEWPDFVAKPDPPDGYRLTVAGCSADQPDGSVALTTDPFDFHFFLSDGSVKVLVKQTRIRASITDGRGAGNVSVGNIGLVLGSNEPVFTGPTRGSFQTLLLTAEELAQIEKHGAAVPRPDG